MSDNVTDTVANGASGVAASENSQQNSNNQDAKAQGFSEDQLKQIGEIVKTAVQSTKDVRFQRLENETNETKKQLSGVSETITRLKDYQEKYGLNEAQAIREMERDDEIAALRREPVSDTVARASAPNLNAIATSIVQGAGLDPNSESVKHWMASQTQTDPAEIAKAAAEFVVTQMNKPKPGAADVVQPTGGAPSNGPYSDMTATQLGAKLTELSRNPSANRQEMKKIRAALDERAPMTRL